MSPIHQGAVLLSVLRKTGKRCPHCRHHQERQLRFCSYCGKKQPQPPSAVRPSPVSDPPQTLWQHIQHWWQGPR
ncbi:MAG: hypothetical protein ACO1RX_09255 [Candidatus Sericytochromatia bacterium]